MNTTIRGHNLRATRIMALLAVLLLLSVALMFALRPAPTTSDRDAKPANYAMSGIKESDVTHLIPTSGSDGNPTIDAVSGTGGSSIPQNPDVERHAEVVERLGNGSLR
jgi:transposase